MIRQERYQQSKLCVWASTALWLSGYVPMYYLEKWAHEEYVTLLVILAGNFYLLAYGRVERFVMRFDMAKVS